MKEISQLMTTDERYMYRSIELAALGSGMTAPNPMVGAIIVHNSKIIGEGYHKYYGGPHAEVVALNSVKKQELLAESTMYVTLEPCSHHGITPPCADLIIRNKIPEVVIGTTDPFSAVAGRGVEKLKKAGVSVTVGVLGEECRRLNKRFITFHTKKRPYIILKWAQTLDGFIDIHRSSNNYGNPTWITGDLSLRLVHKIRSEEGAILIGTNTAEKDNPSLTVRNWSGKQPIRLVIDKSCKLPKSLTLFDNSAKTVIFNHEKNCSEANCEWVKLDFNKNILPQIAEILYNRNILSVIVEGGRVLLNSFIDEGLWDEAHLFIGDKLFGDGVKAPTIKGEVVMSENLECDRLKILYNRFNLL